jgi:hypothetical protein
VCSSDLLSLAEAKGGYLFQLRPDLFPEGYVTDTELALWGLHYEAKHKRLSNRG